MEATKLQFIRIQYLASKMVLQNQIPDFIQLWESNQQDQQEMKTASLHQIGFCYSYGYVDSSVHLVDFPQLPRFGQRPRLQKTRMGKNKQRTV